MRLLNSFKEWLQNVFGFVKDLYDKDGNTFFIAAIFIILILLILVIVLARRAENSEDKPKKKIKYDDIDFSFHDDEESAKHDVKKAEEPEIPKEEPKTEYGIKAGDDRNIYSGKEGLSPEIAEALMNAALKSTDGFDVPNWMSKQTLSLDEMEAIDAQEWVDQQLVEKEAKEHDRNVERATVEKIAAILEKLELEEEDLLKEPGEKAAETPEVKEKTVEKEPEPIKVVPEVVPEPEPTVEPEPKKEPEQVSYETGTLAKILKEAEELKAEESAEASEEEVKDPGWNIAETIARLDAMERENEEIARQLDGSLRDLEEGSAVGLDEQEISELRKAEPVFKAPEISITDEDERDFVKFDRSLLLNGEHNIRRFGPNNRDTNRQGRKFTEEELMETIRD